MKKSSYILFLFLFLNTVCSAVPDSNVVRYETESVIVERTFNKEKLQEAKDNPDYTYDIVVKKEGPSWLDKILYRIGQFLFNVFYSPTGSVESVFFYVICFALVVLFIYLILKMNAIGIFSRTNTNNKADLGFSELDEDINSIDFDKMIEEAVRTGMYRRAVRLNFLKALKLLSDKSLIDWEINKTNRDYFYELKSESIREGFKDITHIYEYVWYGNLELDSEKFSKVNMTFNQFSSKTTSLK